MRFLVMVKATKDSEAGVLPDEKLLAEMGKFNEELVKAGIMLSAQYFEGADMMSALEEQLVMLRLAREATVLLLRAVRSTTRSTAIQESTLRDLCNPGVWNDHNTNRDISPQTHRGTQRPCSITALGIRLLRPEIRQFSGRFFRGEKLWHRIPFQRARCGRGES